MALEQYKDPNSPTYFGYDAQKNEGIAFADQNTFKQYFNEFNEQAPAPSFNTADLLSSPNQLRTLTLPGGTYNVDPMSGGVTPSAGSGVSVPQASIFSLDDLRTGAQTPTSAAALTGFLSNIEKLRGEQKVLQQQLIDASKPSEEQFSLEKQLSELRRVSDMLTINTQAGANAIQRKDIPQQLITGEQSDLFRQSELSLQTMAVQERALAERLGIEVQKQQGVFDRIKTALGFSQESMDLEFRIQEKIDQQNQIVWEQTTQLRDEAKQTLTSILGQFQGKDFDDLPAQVQSHLVALAGKAGVPFSLLSAGMKAVKDELDFEKQQLSKEFALAYGINEPYYRIGNKIYNTATQKMEFEDVGGEYRRIADGFKFSDEKQFFKAAGIKSWENIQSISGGQKDEKALVLDLASRYADAGIRPTDTIDIAQSKLGQSRIYQEQIRPPSSGGGGGGLTPVQTIGYQNQIEDNLRVNPSIQAYGELVNFGVPTVINRFNAGQTDSVADTVLMRTLAKVTDPSTGVREEEYRTFEDSVGNLNRVFTLPKKWVGKGRLTAEGRSAMIREIQDRFNARRTDYVQTYNYYAGQASRVPGVSIPPPLAASGVQPGSSTPPPAESTPAPAPTQQSPTQSFWNKATSLIFGKD